MFRGKIKKIKYRKNKNTNKNNYKVNKMFKSTVKVPIIQDLTPSCPDFNVNYFNTANA